MLPILANWPPPSPFTGTPIVFAFFLAVTGHPIPTSRQKLKWGLFAEFKGPPFSVGALRDDQLQNLDRPREITMAGNGSTNSARGGVDTSFHRAVFLAAAGTIWLVSLLHCSPLLALPSRTLHARAAIYDLGFTGPDVRNGLEAVSGTIDNDIRQGQFTGGHRNFGHWGFGGDIPFESNPALKQYVANNPGAKQEIIDAWADCVRRIENNISASTGISTGAQAHGVAAFVYDHHLLCDYADKVIEPLQPVSGIQRDLIKAARDTFGNRSEFASLLEEHFDKISKDLPVPEQAQLTLDALREAKFGAQLQKTFPKQFAEGKMQLIDERVYATNRQNGALLVNAPRPSMLKTSLEAGKNAALIAGAFSAAVNGRKLLKGEIARNEFLLNVSEDSAQAGIAGAVSTGILEKIGHRYVLTLPMKGALGVGLGTLIFDTTRNVWSLTKGEIDENEFLTRTGPSMIKASASGTAVYVTVLYGAAPGGPVVMAVAIGTYIVADLAIRKIVNFRDSGYLSVEDMVGFVPLAVLDRATVYDPKKRSRLYDAPGDVFSPKNKTLLDEDFHNGRRKTLFDY
jgi:hypothetical protein